MEVTIAMTTVASPASTDEALAMMKSAIGFLNAADVAQMATGEQARCLRAFEQFDAAETAARASILGGFTTRRGYCEDADYSPRTWLIHQTRITRGAAAGHIGWARRAAAHPVIRQALAAAGPFP